MRAGFLRSRLWRLRYWVLGASLVGDVAILARYYDFSSSFGFTYVFEPLLAAAAIAAGLFGGAVLGLATGLLVGSAFFAFASLASFSDHVGAVVAVVIWSGVAFVVGMLAQRRCVRLREGLGLSGPRLVIPLPAQSAVELRASLRAMLERHDIDDGTVEEVVLATQEAFNNAIVHPPGAVDVAASVCSGSVWVHIKDEGPGFDCAALPKAPDPTLDHGRGIFLMRSLMDVVHFESHEGGMCVHMTRAVRPCERCSDPPAHCPQPSPRHTLTPVAQPSEA